MIEVVFAIVLGFSVTSTTCGLMNDGSYGDRTLIRVLVYSAALATMVGLSNGQSVGLGGVFIGLLMASVTIHLPWMALGAVLALGALLITEGHVQNLWIKFHPQSAPTPEARMGQRCYEHQMSRKIVPATLVGSSTQFLSNDLDLKTETLIRLCYFAFEDRGPLMLSRLESNLRLGTGRRQKAFHKIAAGMRGRPDPKRVLHRYWRSVNGSVRMGQALFTELCQLACATGNDDRLTKKRLSVVGLALGLETDVTKRVIQAAL